MVTARQAADAQVADARQILEQDQAMLEIQRSRWIADIDNARRDAADNPLHRHDARIVFCIEKYLT